MNIIIQALYYFLPAYLANMAPVLVRWVPFLDRPVDGGRTYKGQRLFGEHKTWRGIVAASLTGILIFTIQKVLFASPFFQDISLIHYPDFSVFHGFLLGFGAIMGDLVKSFFKRQEGILPGKPWWGYDQLDFVIGALVFSGWWYVPEASVFLVLLVLSPFLHILFNILGYHLRLVRHL